MKFKLKVSITRVALMILLLVIIPITDYQLADNIIHLDVTDSAYLK